MINKIIKRDGEVVDFDVEKLNKWSEWGASTCGVDWTSIVFEAVRGLHEECSTVDLHKTLINVCVSRKDPKYADMAARLLVGDIYKEVYGDFSVPSLKDFYKEMVELGYWDEMGYEDEALDFLDSIIDHTVDITYKYATLKQYVDKYCLKANGKLLETPQMTFMGIAMSNMRNDSLEDVVSLYNELKKLNSNLPTPTLNLERTPSKTSPSCCVISGGDTVASIGAATQIAYDFTARSSGIGIELRTRAPKDPVKGGKIEHGGKHSYFKHIDTAVKSNRQAIRGGSATVTIHCLDPEIDKLLTMKQVRTEATYRIDTMDYSFAVNNLFLRKVAKDEDWYTISPYYANDLWEASYSGNPELFEEMYNRYSSHKKAVKKKARDIFVTWVRSRGDNGRVYMTFLDNVNGHTPFQDPIKLSNLCQEITLPTNHYKDVFDLMNPDSEGEIGLCSLAAIVVSRIQSDEEYENLAYITAKTIDNTIEGMVYPYKQLEVSGKARRSIGVGMTDLATLLAKEGLLYSSQEGRTRIHEIAERHSYYLHKASVRLAKERGACAWWTRTKYAQGWLPIDSYSKAVDEHHDASLKYDWERLRKDMLKYGMRFSVLEAIAPNESSSVLTNTTNSIYPVRSKDIFKSSTKGMVYFYCEDWDKLTYEKAYDIDELDMVKFYSIVQKFTGQSISADFYTRLTGDDTKLSVKNMLKRVLLSVKLGMKTFYYENFLTSEEVEVVLSQSDCEDCKL